MGAWQITKKDLRLLLRDRRAAVVLVALPLAFIGILGMSTGRLLGWRAENQTLSIAFVDEDQGTTAARFRQMLGELDGLRILSAADRDSASQLIEAGDCRVAVILGRDFGRRLAARTLDDVLTSAPEPLLSGLDAVNIEIVGEPGEAAIAGNLALATARHAAIAVRVAGNQQLQRLLASTDSDDQPSPIDPSANADGTPRYPPASEINEPANRTRLDAGNPLDSRAGESSGSGQMPDGRSRVYQQLVPSYTVMFAFFLVNVMARSFISERDAGTLRRLRVAPVSTPGLLAGKTVPFLILSLIQSVVLFVCGRILFGMSWGTQPWLLIPVIVCTSLAATALGLLVATIVRTDSQVSAYANFLVITMAGISGCFMPRDWMPPMMQRISLATPHAWSLIAYDQVFSADVPDLRIFFGCCLVLTGFAIALFAAGCWRFRRQD